MFQQIRAGQQQVYAIVRSIETIVILDVLRRKQLVRVSDVPTITLRGFSIGPRYI